MCQSMCGIPRCERGTHCDVYPGNFFALRTGGSESVDSAQSVVSGAFEGTSMQFICKADIVRLEGLIAGRLAARQHDSLRATEARV